MHGQINRKQSSRTNHALVQFLPRQIEARHIVPALAQPSRWGHYSKRLPPQLVGRNQNDVHLPKYTVKRCGRRLVALSFETVSRRGLGVNRTRSSSRSANCKVKRQGFHLIDNTWLTPGRKAPAR